MQKLIIGLPAGSLQSTTFELLAKAGFKVSASERSYFPMVDDPELDAMLIRAQEIAKYVEQGALDVGLTGHDWILESGADVREICELEYAKQGFAKVRWVLAVHNDSPFTDVSQLQGKRIATELVNVTRRYLDRNGIEADVLYSWGATEAKVPNLADAIVEATETGSSLRANNLTEIDTVLSQMGASLAATGMKPGAQIGLDTTNAAAGTFTRGTAIDDLSGGDNNSIGLAKLGEGQLILDASDVFGAKDADAAQRLLGKADAFLDEYDTQVRAAYKSKEETSEAVARALYFRYLKRTTAHVMNVLTSLVQPLDRLDHYDETKEDR